MKRIFLVFMLFACCTPIFVVTSSAQTTTVATTDFTAKVNLMDAQIGAGDIAAAQSTWLALNGMMKAALDITKNKIRVAATSSDRETYTTLNGKQGELYQVIWGLKKDLVANRSAIHTQLGLFAATM